MHTYPVRLYVRVVSIVRVVPMFRMFAFNSAHIQCCRSGPLHKPHRIRQSPSTTKQIQSSSRHAISTTSQRVHPPQLCHRAQTLTITTSTTSLQPPPTTFPKNFSLLIPKHQPSTSFASLLPSPSLPPCTSNPPHNPTQLASPKLYIGKMRKGELSRFPIKHLPRYQSV